MLGIELNQKNNKGVMLRSGCCYFGTKYVSCQHSWFREGFKNFHEDGVCNFTDLASLNKNGAYFVLSAGNKQTKNPRSQSHFSVQTWISLASMKIWYDTVLGNAKENVTENYTDIFNSVWKAFL